MKLGHTFSFWLDRTARMMKYFAATRAKGLALNITIDQWVILAMVCQNKGISQAELGERTFKDKASVARIADLLEKRGFLERHRNPANRREYRMHCTKAGEAKVAELLPYVQKARNIGIQGFTEEELTLLISMLQRIYRNYENAMENDQT